MARVISAPYGELRGKLGAVVFTRNAYGMVARSHVVPVNPRTAAQVRSRTWFADATQGWCTLPPEVKNAWEEFARSPMRFNPLQRINVGQYVGQVAYISLYMMAARADSIAANNWPFTVTCRAYEIPYEPPQYAVDGSIKTNRGPLPLRLDGAGLSVTGAYSLTFRVDGAPPGGLVLPAGDIVDGHGTPFGLGFYVSTPVKDPGNRPSQPLFIHAAQGCPAQVAEDTPLPGDTLTISGTVSLPADQYRYGLQHGVLRVTAVQVGMNGQARILGAVYVSV